MKHHKPVKNAKQKVSLRPKRSNHAISSHKVHSNVRKSSISSSSPRNEINMSQLDSMPTRLDSSIIQPLSTSSPSSMPKLPFFRQSHRSLLSSPLSKRIFQNTLCKSLVSVYMQPSSALSRHSIPQLHALPKHLFSTTTTSSTAAPSPSKPSSSAKPRPVNKNIQRLKNIGISHEKTNTMGRFDPDATMTSPPTAAVSAAATAVDVTMLLKPSNKNRNNNNDNNHSNSSKHHQHHTTTKSATTTTKTAATTTPLPSSSSTTSGFSQASLIIPRKAAPTTSPIITTALIVDVHFAFPTPEQRAECLDTINKMDNIGELVQHIANSMRDNKYSHVFSMFEVLISDSSNQFYSRRNSLPSSLYGHIVAASKLTGQRHLLLHIVQYVYRHGDILPAQTLVGILKEYTTVGDYRKAQDVLELISHPPESVKGKYIEHPVDSLGNKQLYIIDNTQEPTGTMYDIQCTSILREHFLVEMFKQHINFSQAGSLLRHYLAPSCKLLLSESSMRYLIHSLCSKRFLLMALDLFDSYSALYSLRLQSELASRIGLAALHNNRDDNFQYMLKVMEERQLPPSPIMLQTLITHIIKTHGSLSALEWYKRIYFISNNQAGFNYNLSAANIIIENLIKDQNTHEALTLLSHLPCHISTVNILLNGFTQLKDYDSIRLILKYINKRDLPLDQNSISHIIDALAYHPDPQTIRTLLDIFWIRNIQPPKFVLAHIIRSLKIQRQPLLAEEILEEVRIKTKEYPNIMLYTLIIQGYIDNDQYDEAIRLYEMTLTRGMSPSIVTIGILLDGALNTLQSTRLYDLIKHCILYQSKIVPQLLTYNKVQQLLYQQYGLNINTMQLNSKHIFLLWLHNYVKQCCLLLDGVGLKAQSQTLFNSWISWGGLNIGRFHNKAFSLALAQKQKQQQQQQSTGDTTTTTTTPSTIDSNTTLEQLQKEYLDSKLYSNAPMRFDNINRYIDPSEDNNNKNNKHNNINTADLYREFLQDPLSGRIHDPRVSTMNVTRSENQQRRLSLLSPQRRKVLQKEDSLLGDHQEDLDVDQFHQELLQSQEKQYNKYNENIPPLVGTMVYNNNNNNSNIQYTLSPVYDPLASFNTSFQHNSRNSINIDLLTSTHIPFSSLSDYIMSSSSSITSSPSKGGLRSLSNTTNTQTSSLFQPQNIPSDDSFRHTSSNNDNIDDQHFSQQLNNNFYLHTPVKDVTGVVRHVQRTRIPNKPLTLYNNDNRGNTPHEYKNDEDSDDYIGGDAPDYIQKPKPITDKIWLGTRKQHNPDTTARYSHNTPQTNYYNKVVTKQEFHRNEDGFVSGSIPINNEYHQRTAQYNSPLGYDERINDLLHAGKQKYNRPYKKNNNNNNNKSNYHNYSNNTTTKM